MPGSNSNNIFSNAIGTQLNYAAAVTFPTLGANVSGTNTFAIPGVLPGDFIYAQMTAPPGHIFLENAYVSAAGIVTLSWTTDGTGVTGSTMPVTFMIWRPEGPVTGLPTSFY